MATEAEYDDGDGGPAIFLLRAAETKHTWVCAILQTPLDPPT